MNPNQQPFATNGRSNENSSESPASIAPGTQSRALRVLVVDDHALMVAGMVQFLNKQKEFPVAAEGCPVHDCDGRLSAKTVDAVIVDIRMGRVDGICSVSGWKKSFPDIRYFIFSACGDLGSLHRALREEVSGYLHKEDDPMEIIRALQMGSPECPYLSRSMREKFPHAKDFGKAFDSLSKREMHLLSLMAELAGNKDLAEHMGVSVKTVESHKENLKTKLGLASVSALREVVVFWRSSREGHGQTCGGNLS